MITAAAPGAWPEANRPCADRSASHGSRRGTQCKRWCRTGPYSPSGWSTGPRRGRDRRPANRWTPTSTAGGPTRRAVRRCFDPCAYVLAFAGRSDGSRSLDRRRVPPVRAGGGGMRGRRPRLPTSGRSRLAWALGRRGHGRARPVTPTRSTCRRAQPTVSDVPGGRRSGSPAWERLTYCKATTATPREWLSQAQAVMLRSQGLERVHHNIRLGPPSLAGVARPTHPATWTLLGPRLRRFCLRSAVVVAAG